MKLIEGWHDICRKAWSFRLSVICAAFSGLEVALPALVTAMPAGYFAALSCATAIGASVARVISQEDLHD